MQETGNCTVSIFDGLKHYLCAITINEELLITDDCKITLRTQCPRLYYPQRRLVLFLMLLAHRVHKLVLQITTEYTTIAPQLWLFVLQVGKLQVGGDIRKGNPRVFVLR